MINLLAISIFMVLCMYGVIRIIEGGLFDRYGDAAMARYRRRQWRLEHPRPPIPPADMPLWKALAIGVGLCILATLVFMPLFMF